jgi:hypothetical protein
MSAPSSAQTAIPAVNEEDFLNYLNEHWSCGQPARLSQAQTQEILSKGDPYTLHSRWSRDPVVIADVPGLAAGTMIFRRVGGRWQPAFLSEGSNVEAILSMRDESRAFIVSMWVREDPGDLAVVSYDWRTGSIACADLDGPRDLDRPLEYAQFKRLELNANGHGQLLAFAVTDPDGAPGYRFYTYKTGNYGHSWSSPQRLAHLPHARNGLASASRGLDASLRALIEADSHR